MKAKRRTNGATKAPAFVARAERGFIRVLRTLREETRRPDCPMTPELPHHHDGELISDVVSDRTVR